MAAVSREIRPASRRVVPASGITAVLTAVLVLVGAAPAFAHERRTVGGFQFAVGWGDEPPYTGFKNSVQVTLSETNGGPPVTDLGDSLKVEVSKGSDSTTLPLEANFRVGAFGTPGDYRAWLTPTRPGTYTFHFTGSIRGQRVDESFTSSKTTFNDVDDVASIEFPAKDPSTGQLATRIDREVSRLDAAVRKADDRVDSARTLATVGVVIGALGLLTAAGALSGVGRRRPRPGGDGGGTEADARAKRAGSLNR
jgi:hypothetical protein